MAKKKVAREPVKKRTPAEPKEPKEPIGLSQREAAKIRKDVKKTETVTTKKAPKKDPKPVVKTGRGFCPGRRKQLRKEHSMLSLQLKRINVSEITNVRKNEVHQKQQVKKETVLLLVHVHPRKLLKQLLKTRRKKLV